MKLKWDQTGERIYETGVDRGVVFVYDTDQNKYGTGVAWSGLTKVNESPSGAESNPQYADNIKYLDLYSAEDFGATIEAFTYPPEFEECDGSAELAQGVTIGMQNRKMFGFAYRTLVGNDTKGTDFGYKIHLVYGAKASPSEKSRDTVNDSPEAVTFSWEVTTTPVNVTGFKPTAHLVVNSTLVDPTKLQEFEKKLYGDDSAGTPTLPMPDEVKAMFAEG
jgi:hypothetical protein|nr:MAG TPA: tail tube protein [Caudoviricetes sp.]